MEEEKSNSARTSIPASRIKKIMKSTHSGNVSKEASFAMAVATEAFIQRLSTSSFEFTEKGKRKTVKGEDVAHAYRSSNAFDFLTTAES